LDQLPPFTDYAMQGRTYRYMDEEPLYAFGYGLSYTTFGYSKLSLGPKPLKVGQSLTVSVEVENTGSVAGDEVTQLYLSDLEASVRIPRWQLRGFKRLHLKSGEKKIVSFSLTPRQMALIDDQGRCILEPGTFRVYLGGSQPDSRSKVLTGSAPLSTDFELTGDARELVY
jgi:beta-glucosidase